MGRAKLFAAFVLGLCAVPVLVYVSARLGLLPVRATGKPPAIEEKIAMLAVDKSLERSSRRLTSPVVDDAPALLAGLKLYRQNCAGCHGDFKAPSAWGMKNYYPRAPQFAEEVPDLSVPEMFVAIKYGIRYSGMGGWEGMMPDDDIWRVSMFLGRLGSLPPDVDAAWRAIDARKPR